MPANSRWDLIRRLRVNTFYDFVLNKHKGDDSPQTPLHTYVKDPQYVYFS